MYISDMARKSDTGAIISFPTVRTPLGTLNFGAQLKGTSGTGFDGFRVFGMYALVLLQAGGGRYRDQRGVDLRLKPGDGIVVFPELGHQYGPESGDTWEEIFVTFEGAAFDGWRFEGLDPAFPVWHVGEVGRWTALFEGLLRSQPSNRADACFALGQLHGILSGWLALRPNRKQSPPWLEKACHALAAPAGGMAVPEIARRAGMGYDSFRRAFRLATGQSPSAYRRGERLAQADQMLRREDLTLEQVAAALGFCDAFHLSKVFKQERGISPSAYRKGFH